MLWGDNDPVAVGLADTVDNRSLLAQDVPGTPHIVDDVPVVYHPTDEGPYNDFVSGQDGNDVLYGGPGNDATLQGGTGNDVTYGGDGNDTLTDTGGENRLYGNAGNDVLTGGSGNDLLAGNDGNDFLKGNAGNDVLIGGAGNDTLFGDAGNDLLYGGFLAFDDTPEGGWDNSRSVDDDADAAMLALLNDWKDNSRLNTVPNYANTTVVGEANGKRGNAGRDAFVAGTVAAAEFNLDFTLVVGPNGPDRTDPFAP